MTILYFNLADLGGRRVIKTELRQLACWDCGFESRRGHGCLSVVSVVCCQVEVPLLHGIRITLNETGNRILKNVCTHTT
jgi:hypothetical protein